MFAVAICERFHSICTYSFLQDKHWKSVEESAASVTHLRSLHRILAFRQQQQVERAQAFLDLVSPSPTSVIYTLKHVSRLFYPHQPFERPCNSSSLRRASIVSCALWPSWRRSSSLDVPDFCLEPSFGFDFEASDAVDGGFLPS